MDSPGAIKSSVGLGLSQGLPFPIVSLLRLLAAWGGNITWGRFGRFPSLLSAFFRVV